MDGKKTDIKSLPFAAVEEYIAGLGEKSSGRNSSMSGCTYIRRPPTGR